MKIENSLSDDALYAEIGDRVRFARIQSRIKQADFADRCGISRSALIKLEKGDGGTRLSTFLAVIRQLGALHSFDVFLPERQISPEMQLMIDRKLNAFPKTVRDHRKRPVSAAKWGDGVAIERRRHA